MQIQLDLEVNIVNKNQSTGVNQTESPAESVEKFIAPKHRNTKITMESLT